MNENNTNNVINIDRTQRNDKAPMPAALKFSAVVAAGAVAAGMFSPRMKEEVPETPPTYEQLVQESAQKPLTDSDEVLVANIPVETTVSEAVGNSPEVTELKLGDPSQVPAIVTSANWTDESAKAVSVVARDIDKDGDKDAIVVASE